MKILYVGLKFDYGKPERGFSFEHYNFYESLVAMNGGEHEIVYFAFDEVMQAEGRDGMNKKLLEAVEQQRPDVGWVCIFQDEIDKETLLKVKEKIPTFNWFTDDHWRFDNFGKHYVPYFTFIGTTDSQAPAKYHSLGFNNEIKTQWAANHHAYKPTGIDPEKIGRREEGDFDYDVSFVGQPHGDRGEVVKKIRLTGVKVDCYGGGWPNGRVSQEKMLEIFSRSKINLNLTKSSEQISFKQLVKVFLRRRSDNKYTLYSPWMWLDNWRSLRNKKREQIKGRNFEVPAMGGLLLTGDADNLGDYYVDGKEIVIFHSVDELIEKAKYYLAHPQEREAIALAGYQRTLSEHTYEKRFNDIFKIMGF